MDSLKITYRHLPHWTLDDSTYFVTFCTMNGILSVDEVILTLNHVKIGNDKYYNLFCAIVMPDHSHIIIKPFPEYSLDRIMKGIKGASARKINIQRNSKGSIWQDESFDRIIRDQKELEDKILYMFNNPIKKGLTDNTFHYHEWYLNYDLLNVSSRKGLSDIYS